MYYVFILLFGLLSSCSENPSIVPAAARTDSPVKTPSPPDAYPQVLKGWLPEYSAFVESKVSDDFPGLLGLDAVRMGTVCPKWIGLDRGEREKFWSALLYSIAGPESGRSRTVVYRETTMSIDSVTGLQIRSEGLLQLSYVDVPNYRYPNGDISWEDDKEMALADYAASVRSGNPARTILNAYSNLNLGLFIMNRLAASYPGDSLEKTFGRYWSVMRSANSTFAIVMSSLKSKMPACF